MGTTVGFSLFFFGLAVGLELPK